MMGRLKSWPWFALLAAVYPVLALLAHNLGQVKPTVADRSLLVSAVGALIVMGLLRWLLRDWTRAALLTAWGTLLFFSYGPVYDSLKAITLSGETLGPTPVSGPSLAHPGAGAQHLDPAERAGGCQMGACLEPGGGCGGGLSPGPTGLVPASGPVDQSGRVLGGKNPDPCRSRTSRPAANRPMCTTSSSTPMPAWTQCAMNSAMTIPLSWMI